jgi:hypothetical protein
VITETNKTFVRHFMERAFNEGDLAIVDETHAPGAIDHQEPAGTDFATHLKAVITMLLSVAHMHFVRLLDGKTSDLWHVWDVAGLMRQLGVASAPRP